MEGFGDIPRTNRKAFVTKFKTRIQYFKDNSSLASVGHVISLSHTSMFKRLFWFVTFFACCYGSLVILRGALGLFIADAISYSVETDYLHWDTPFPAVTVCEQLNDSKVSIALKKKYPTSLIGFAKEIAFWSIKFCKNCANCKMNSTCIEDFLPILDVARSHCEQVMTVCSYNEEEFPCCERFKPIATEYGVCFSFNSELTGDGDLIVNRKIGLPSLIFNVVGKVSVIVHSPDESISAATEKILGTCYHLSGMSLQANIVVEEIVNDVSVHSIAPSSRDCLFRDDHPPALLKGWPFKDYTYSGCVWYCRTMAQVKMCNCSHHFMPKIGNIPMCNTEGLKCLFINRLSIEVENCHCPMSCEEVTYKAIHATCPRNTESRGTKGIVRISQFPHLRVRRQAIRDMLGLVVDVGGVVGVFFGASLLTFIEIVYIFCIRKYDD